MMASKKADPDKLAADMSPPNYRAALQRLRTIQAKKDKIAGVNGDIADIYAKVEGHKVNRKAAKVWVMVDKLEQADREAFMRSFNGLCDAAGWDAEAEDLVDQAEGNVVHLRMGRADASEDRDDDADAADELSETDQSNAFLAGARRHLGSGPADNADAAE